MYETLHNKILKLDDAVEVYPAHGAGSMCGKNLSNEKSSTIGQQRKFNYALKPLTKDEFVCMMTADLPEAPAYFPKDAEINRTGASSLNELPPLMPLSPPEVLKHAKHSEAVLDVRSAADFAPATFPDLEPSGGWTVRFLGRHFNFAGCAVVIVPNQTISERRQVRWRARSENVKGYLAVEFTRGRSRIRCRGRSANNSRGIERTD